MNKKYILSILPLLIKPVLAYGEQGGTYIGNFFVDLELLLFAGLFMLFFAVITYGLRKTLKNASNSATITLSLILSAFAVYGLFKTGFSPEVFFTNLGIIEFIMDFGPWIAIAITILVMFFFGLSAVFKLYGLIFILLAILGMISKEIVYNWEISLMIGITLFLIGIIMKKRKKITSATKTGFRTIGKASVGIGKGVAKVGRGTIKGARQIKKSINNFSRWANLINQKIKIRKRAINIAKIRNQKIKKNENPDSITKQIEIEQRERLQEEEELSKWENAGYKIGYKLASIEHNIRKALVKSKKTSGPKKMSLLKYANTETIKANKKLKENWEKIQDQIKKRKKSQKTEIAHQEEDISQNKNLDEVTTKLEIEQEERLKEEEELSKWENAGYKIGYKLASIEHHIRKTLNQSKKTSGPKKMSLLKYAKMETKIAKKRLETNIDNLKKQIEKRKKSQKTEKRKEQHRISKNQKMLKFLSSLLQEKLWKLSEQEKYYASGVDSSKYKIKTLKNEIIEIQNKITKYSQNPID